MKNLQRGIGVLALIALLMMANTLFAQEATEEATAEPEVTEMATEMTEEAEATDMATEATSEATDMAEMTPEATEMMEEVTPEVTEPVATAAPEITPEVTVEPVVTATPIPEIPGSSVTVVGSGVVNPALQSLINASGSIVDFNITTTGSSAGFDQFCPEVSVEAEATAEAEVTPEASMMIGADMATSIRPITVEEDNNCRQAGVEYLELLIGYDVMVVISNVEDNYLGCLTTENMNSIFAPGATASNWSEINLINIEISSVLFHGLERT